MVSDICFLLIVCADTLLEEDQNEGNDYLFIYLTCSAVARPWPIHTTFHFYHSVESHLKFQYSMNTYIKVHEYFPEVNQ